MFNKIKKHIPSLKSEIKNSFLVRQTVKKEQNKLENQILLQRSIFFHIFFVNSWMVIIFQVFFEIIGLGTFVFQFSTQIKKE